MMRASAALFRSVRRDFVIPSGSLSSPLFLPLPLPLPRRFPRGDCRTVVAARPQNSLFLHGARFAAASSGSINVNDVNNIESHHLPSTGCPAPTKEQISITLFQYQICPFCNKVKALLSYARQPYDVVEVNPLTKAELKSWSGDYTKVPIAQIDGKQVNGSSEIIAALMKHPSFLSKLETERWRASSTSPSSGVGGSKTTATMTADQFANGPLVERWTKFADEDLPALLYPNICRSVSDSYRTFGYVRDVPNFSMIQRWSIRSLGSVAMYLAASRVKSKRGITDEREALHAALSEWEAEGLAGQEFCSSGGGDNGKGTGAGVPNLGDLAVFGVLHSVHGLPAHYDAIERRGGDVKRWYDRMFTGVFGLQASTP